ncbi:MAG TPA: amino acid adenylation domain-containing protein, partial [Herpetosiphonaceae bacterium]
MGDFSERFNALSPKKQELLRLLRAEKAKAAAPGPTIPRRPPGDSAPLSFAQERLWFLDQLQPGSAFYNEPVAVRLTGALDVAALHQSLNAIVRRHETLRTTFAPPESVDGSPRQVIAPSLKIELPVLDLRGLPLAEREAEAERLGAAEVARPFDLTAGPLLRAVLLRLADDDHIALLTFHHIIFDGWSAGVLVQELATFYAAFATGNQSAPPELPIQYADYAVWQRDWMEGETLDRQLDYWRRQLQDAPPTLDLPTDYQRPALQSFRGARETLKLSPALSESLKALSQREDATLFMTLLAAFNVLLYRYSGQADLCVGTRIAGRSQVATERLIGFFLNALVLRADLSGNPSFRELLGHVRETALGAYAHQELPFEKLVQELRPERSLSHQPLFQVMFVLQNAPMPPLELPDLTLRPLKFGGGTAKLDLDFAMIEEADRLSGLLEYNTDIFSAATIRRMLDHFQVLLAAIVADPDQCIDLLPLLTDAERHTLLVEWNATAADYPGDRCIHELFQEQARRTPDAVAIICRDQRLTFAELDRLTSQVAHRLQALGVGPETPVGVLIERSHKTVVALLGILKAGGCYVPLDPAYPPSHLAFVLADTRLPVLIAEERLRGLVQLEDLDHQLVVLPVDDSWSAVASEPTHLPITTITPDNIFYIMYTSGSTGQPKGVVVAQRQLLNRFAWMWRAYPFAPGEVMCQRTTVNFTVSIWELLGPMLRGVPTVVIPDEVVKDARAFVEALAEARVTRIVLVPSLLQMILDSGLDLARLLARLTLWSVCGEALSLELVRRFRELLPHAVLLNQYGASEMNDTAVFDTRLQPVDQPFVPLGRPIPNLQIYLLDHQLQPVPIGVPGALHVGSVSLARGYLNRPDLTAEKFIPHPFSGLNGNPPGSRLYNTGDLARYHADGTLEYLGRRDHQVKIRGVRVELGEIEAV